MRLMMLAAAAALLASSALAQTPAPATAPPAGAYVSDPTHTSVTWKVLHQSLSWYTARFTTTTIALDFNPADVSKSKVTASIDPKSVETDFMRTRPAGNTADFNNEIATGERFLNTGKFPKIEFVSTSIKKTGEKTGTMTGNLTFLGVTKPVTLDVTFIGDRNDPRIQKHKVGFQAVGTFKKSDFGLAFPVVGDDVKIEVNSELAQK
jgi:polyisoprenoid-binding protein YceI